jgi:hypothetical protein
MPPHSSNESSSSGPKSAVLLASRMLSEGLTGSLPGFSAVSKLAAGFAHLSYTVGDVGPLAGFEKVLSDNRNQLNDSTQRTSSLKAF